MVLRIIKKYEKINTFPEFILSNRKMNLICLSIIYVTATNRLLQDKDTYHKLKI